MRAPLILRNVETTTRADQITEDLLRSTWIIQSARALVYRDWAQTDSRFERFADRADRAAQIIEPALRGRGRAPDGDLVAPHAAWINQLVPRGPDTGELADVFVVRLGDWVEAHGAPFLAEGADDLKKLADEDRREVSLPSSFPDPPGFEPLHTPTVAAPGATKFRFGVLGDLHIGSRRGEETARAAVADLNASGAELVIQLGDITDEGNKSQFERAAEILGELQMPYATMIGNHDVFSREEERLSGHEYYTPSFGREPEGLILEHKGFRFAVLDSAEYGASPFAPYDIVTGTFAEGAGGAIVQGSLTPPQHEILAEIAAPARPPTFVFLHHPPQPFTSFPPVLFGLRDEDSGRLHAACDSGHVWGVFAGHTHRNARTRSFGDVPAHEVGIPRDYPHGYALVDVGDDGYAYRFLQISDQELLSRINASAGLIQRRYARGRDDELAFSWRRPG